MIDAISKLVESGAISEDVQKSIQEAWDSKIKENREVVSAELREEFAKRYNITYANAVQKRRRIVQKIKDRIFSKNVRVNHG